MANSPMTKRFCWGSSRPCIHGNWEAPEQLLAEIETLPKGKPNSYWNSQQEDAIEALMQAELNPRSFVAVHVHLLSI